MLKHRCNAREKRGQQLTHHSPLFMMMDTLMETLFSLGKHSTAAAMSMTYVEQRQHYQASLRSFRASNTTWIQDTNTLPKICTTLGRQKPYEDTQTTSLLKARLEAPSRISTCYQRTVHTFRSCASIAKRNLNYQQVTMNKSFIVDQQLSKQTTKFADKQSDKQTDRQTDRQASR